MELPVNMFHDIGLVTLGTVLRPEFSVDSVDATLDEMCADTPEIYFNEFALYRYLRSKGTKNAMWLLECVYDRLCKYRASLAEYHAHIDISLASKMLDYNELAKLVRRSENEKMQENEEKRMVDLFSQLSLG
jgi:hypothetical protein